MRSEIDPYTPSTPLYECTACGHRTDADHFGRCPDCDGSVRNIAVSRE